jgi:hypothetical protein
MDPQKYPPGKKVNSELVQQRKIKVTPVNIKLKE